MTKRDSYFKLGKLLLQSGVGITKSVIITSAVQQAHEKTGDDNRFWQPSS